MGGWARDSQPAIVGSRALSACRGLLVPDRLLGRGGSARPGACGLLQLVPVLCISGLMGTSGTAG
jgi:hypothetical protein